MNRYVRIALSASIAIILIAFMIILVGIENIISMLLQVSTHPLYLLLFLAAFLGAFLFRAKRLKVIVGHDDIPLKFYLNILFVSWFLNVIIPARIGEGAQIALLNTEHNVPVGSAAASVVTDKLFDLIALLVLFSGLLFMVGIDLQQELGLGLFILVALLIIVTLFIGLILIAVIPDKLNKFVNTLFGRFTRFSTVLCRLINSASAAIKRLGTSKRQIVVLFLLSLPVWILEAITLFLIASAIGYNFPIINTMTASVSAFLSMTIPITPGGFGTYELVMGFILSILVAEAPLETVALPLAITEHLLRQVVTLFVGAIATSILGTKFGGLLELTKKYRMVETSETASEAPQT